MINFEHKLPSMNIDGRHNGTYNNTELAFPSVLTTTDPKLGCIMRSAAVSTMKERWFLSTEKSLCATKTGFVITFT